MAFDRCNRPSQKPDSLPAPAPPSTRYLQEPLSPPECRFRCRRYQGSLPLTAPAPAPRIKTGTQGSQLFSSPGRRSEEHTSELQSRPHLVCRLLLEKKKK